MKGVNITTTDDRPLFLCEWDVGSLTEVHTRESLKSQYGDTNLYDPLDVEDGGHLWIKWTNGKSVYPSMATFDEVLDEMCSSKRGDPTDRTTDYSCDNMKIARIR
jgi:hypothetical protein